MGYGSYVVSGGRHDGEECGYTVSSICDADGCAAEIDRGLGYLCGREPGGSENSCGGYFCEAHLTVAFDEHDESVGQRCGPCADEIEATVADPIDPGDAVVAAAEARVLAVVRHVLAQAAAEGDIDPAGAVLAALDDELPDAYDALLQAVPQREPPEHPGPATTTVESGDMAIELPLPRDKVVDLMAALEQSVAAAKAARARHPRPAAGALCDSIGPRIGQQAPRCVLPPGHDGRHQAHESWAGVDGAGPVTWRDW